MRLIDVDKIPGAFLIAAIAEAPAVDAAPVIRCKDCAHFKQSKVLGNTCALTDNHVTKKDYCSKAERKEKDGE